MSDNRYALPAIIAWRCPYCDYYGGEFVGTRGTVSRHAKSHPINVEPVRNGDNTNEEN